MTYRSAGEIRGFVMICAVEMAHIDNILISPYIAPSEENGLDMEAIELAQRAMVENAGLSMELIDSWNLNPLEPLVCATAWHSMA